jgi:hypothetical protein
MFSGAVGMAGSKRSRRRCAGHCIGGPPPRRGESSQGAKRGSAPVQPVCTAVSIAVSKDLFAKNPSTELLTETRALAPRSRKKRRQRLRLYLLGRLSGIPCNRRAQILSSRPCAPSSPTDSRPFFLLAPSSSNQQTREHLNAMHQRGVAEGTGEASPHQGRLKSVTLSVPGG